MAKAAVKDNNPMFAGSELDAEADGFWWRASNRTLKALLDVLADEPDSFLVETLPCELDGNCWYGWEIKQWRMKDGSLLNHSGGYGAIGCYAKAWFSVSSEELPLKFQLCAEHFREFFPQFADQMEPSNAGRPGGRK